MGSSRDDHAFRKKMYEPVTLRTRNCIRRSEVALTLTGFQTVASKYLFEILP